MNDYLICYPVAGYQARVLSFKDRCSVCGGEVWRAYSSPAVDMTVLCVACAELLLQPGDILVPPTPEQLRDIGPR